MGGASSVLAPGNRRVQAAAGLLALLAAYYVFSRRLPNLPTWGDIAFIGLLLIPAVFALMWLALPLRNRRGLLAIAVALAALAAVTELAGLEVVANFAKLAAATAIAFWFLGYFESALWVAIVALLIPFVDAYSVWRGPTRHILDERPEVFTALSYSFPLPGERQAFLSWDKPSGANPLGYDVLREPGPAGPLNEEPVVDRDGNGRAGYLEAELDATRDYRYTVVALYPETNSTAPPIPAPAEDTNGGVRLVITSADPRSPTEITVESVDAAAKLGLPDLLFFALFLSAADAYRLRLRATWLLMAASFGTTLALTYVFYLDGLPALPLLAIGFLVANADLLWRQFAAAWKARGSQGTG